MWAQDATAMYGYAGASASATTLPPFSSGSADDERDIGSSGRADSGDSAGLRDSAGSDIAGGGY